MKATVKRRTLRFEHKSEPLLSNRDFVRRLLRCGSLSSSLVVISLALGMLGYHGYEGLPWLDAFLDSAMLLGGMGPIHVPSTEAGKVFAGLYALYCGFVVLLGAGLVMAPIAHRLLHRFHLEGK